MRLDGKVALVTGGSGIIGGAIATRLAAAGATVALLARDRARLEETAARITDRTGRPAVAITGDLDDPDDVARALEDAREAVGDIDVLVNNAFHVGGEGPLVGLSRDDWVLPRQINVLAPFQLSTGCARTMMRGAGGSIVNVLSTAAFSPQPPLGAYGVTKAALWSLTRYLAAECAPRVRVNAVTPGTTSADGELTIPAWRAALPLVPLGRIGAAAETAEAVLFLASDASSYTTGQNLFVDDGRVNCLSGRAAEPGATSTDLAGWGTGVMPAPTGRGRFAGRTVLITRASGYLGSACAAGFAAEGANLMLTARRAAPREALAADLAERGCRVACLPADLRAPGTAEDLAVDAWRAFDGLDVVVSRAVPPEPGPVRRRGAHHGPRALGADARGDRVGAAAAPAGARPVAA